MTDKRKYEEGKQVTSMVWQYGNATNVLRRYVTGYDVDVVGREL
jgi:hypothetical protein